MEESSSSVDGAVDEVLLPGFRFHPTDEELVAFYLKRKVEEKPLVIELIRQLDIYKYDPWDLPSLAPTPTTGEKEWYFYCPRERKYRNSSRPNRVTAAGFWKATGTDRPVYSSEGPSCKCIGLKKSLVFYRGRASKGTKTDWMMHEFRLPSPGTSLKPHPLDKNIHPNDSWAICRIFKKTTPMAQRMLNESMGHPTLSNTKNMDHAFTPNSRMPDTKSSFCCPLLDITTYQPSTHMNSTEYHQFSVVATLVSGAEETVMRKNENSFYVGTDVTDHFKSWDSPSCPSEISGSWSSENCYNSFDELLQ